MSELRCSAGSASGIQLPLPVSVPRSSAPLVQLPLSLAEPLPGRLFPYYSEWDSPLTRQTSLPLGVRNVENIAE